MAETVRVGDLEIDQDLEHVRADWKVQRIGWTVMLLIAIGGVLGAFGRGPLASARVEAPGLRLDYDRFARHGALTYLEAEVSENAAADDTVSLWFDREFLGGVDIERITPEPDRETASADILILGFATRGAARPFKVRIGLRPDALWLRRGRAGTRADAQVSFKQFVYP